MRVMRTKADLRKSYLKRLPSPPIPGRWGKGIRRAVEILQRFGIETFESCEGGIGHSYTEPTVKFYGTP